MEFDSEFDLELELDFEMEMDLELDLELEMELELQMVFDLQVRRLYVITKKALLGFEIQFQLNRRVHEHMHHKKPDRFGEYRIFLEL